MGTTITRRNIAEGVSTKQLERRRIKDDFTKARNSYMTAVSHVVTLSNDLAEAKVTIQHERDNQKGIEAGWGVPNGTNVEERKACLAEWKEGSEDWRECQRRIVEAEALIKRSEPLIAAEEYDIRMARYEMEWSITEGRMVAGEDDERHQR